ncbi:hypothetical protein CONCODRAFT_12432 [Conidiobolus coronatus NRRL 28638]|uniref:Uncharacterized protein n=1 Tax=Conidiobolus coronatus (strain ATCC 28846 / CBS 209.66 / NRRL 28638) TaxID=796925 RepID=A0A137NT18_CONC2|nr:hypothetical protein CONCODRAFT_12432 [Conidiobolus coronatus NRRL 28638]|eukprot:KXN65862.1 hypothetical protein CONCODRAFT_12432 [Conidiobolus coronatus NRRL 28638]
MSTRIEFKICDLKKDMNSSDTFIRDSAILETALFLNLIIQIQFAQVCALWEGVFYEFETEEYELDQDIAAKVLGSIAFKLVDSDLASEFIEDFWSILNYQWPEIYDDKKEYLYNLITEIARSPNKLLNDKEWKIYGIHSLIDTYTRVCLDVKNEDISTVIPPNIASRFRNQFSREEDVPARIGRIYDHIIFTLLEMLPKNYDLINQSLYEGLEYFAYLKLLSLIDCRFIDDVSSYNYCIKAEAHAYQDKLASQLSKIKHDIVQSELTEYAIGYSSDIISQSSYDRHTIEPSTPVDYTHSSQHRIAIARRPSTNTRIPHPIEWVDRQNLKRQSPSEDDDINEYRSKKFASASDHSYDASSSSEEDFSECYFPEFNINNSSISFDGNISNCNCPECDINQYIVSNNEEFMPCQCTECTIDQHFVSAETPNFKRLLVTEVEDVEYNSRRVSGVSYQQEYLSTPSENSLLDSEYIEGSARKIRRITRNN